MNDKICNTVKNKRNKKIEVIKEKIGKRGATQGVKDFPGGHPSYYYSRPSTLNCGVLMGSGALVLV